MRRGLVDQLLWNLPFDEKTKKRKVSLVNEFVNEILLLKHDILKRNYAHDSLDRLLSEAHDVVSSRLYTN